MCLCPSVFFRLHNPLPQPLPHPPLTVLQPLCPALLNLECNKRDVNVFSVHIPGITAEMHNNKLDCGECAAQSVQRGINLVCGLKFAFVSLLIAVVTYVF